MTREEREKAKNVINELELYAEDLQYNSADEMKEALDMTIREFEQEPCGDAISRTATLNTLDTMDKALDENRTVEEYKELLRECYEQLPPVSTEKTDAYKQGWHDAIEKALKETYTIHHYGDIFRVVQEETLIGVGMAYEHPGK